MKRYVEIRATLRRAGKPRIVPLEDRYEYTGFTSLYAFDETAKKLIDEQGNMNNFTGTPVYSDTLFVDFDDSPEAAEDMIRELQPYNFKSYHSGGRSIHIHIEIEPMEGSNVPKAQKNWMAENFPKADLSIYKTTGIYRLPGTYHIKNPGKRKELITENTTGVKLIIPNTIAPDPDLPHYLFENDTKEDYHEWLANSLGHIVRPGNQKNKANQIIYVAKQCGYTREEVVDLMNMWNGRDCRPPLKEHEIMSIINRKFGS